MQNNIFFTKNGCPMRGNKMIAFMITDFCILGDCWQPECHHCFPVKNCNKHKICKLKGIHKFIPIPTIQKKFKD